MKFIDLCVAHLQSNVKPLEAMQNIVIATQ